VPDADYPARLSAFFETIQLLQRDDVLLAYHDIADGGLFATLCEMAFASRSGLAIEVPKEVGALPALFAEELGAVVQVRERDVPVVGARFAAAGIAVRAVGGPTGDARIRFEHAGATVLDETRADLHRAWSATTHALQRLRDNPTDADQEYERIADDRDPGLAPLLTFDPAEDIAAPFIARGARPTVAVLREQGVNGHVEMAAAFDRAGFDAFDVHMSDIIAGRRSLARFAGIVACGGFSYGDVLGAGEGWAKSILFNARARDMFAAFFERTDTFTLGVCNGCQMVSALKEIIPGAKTWPRFVRNRSEGFEARLALI